MLDLPNSIFDMLELEKFRKKTAMFMGTRSITLLRTFIDGYFYATDTNNINIDDSVRFGELHDWIANYFGWNGSTAGWSTIILRECDGNESLALDTFFELYDLFKVRTCSTAPMATSQIDHKPWELNELQGFLARNLRNEKSITVTIHNEIPGLAMNVLSSSAMLMYGLGKQQEPGFALHLSFNNNSGNGRKAHEALSACGAISEFKNLSTKISSIYLYEFDNTIESLVNKIDLIMSELKSLATDREPRLTVNLVTTRN